MAKHTLQFMFFEGIHISFMGNDCVLIIGGGGVEGKVKSIGGLAL